MSFRHHVGDLVHGASNEIHKLKLSHRAHPSKRCPKSRTNNRRFRNRRINHTLCAKAVDEPISDFERSAINTNVLTNTKDGWIAFHLLPNPPPDSLKICKLCHELNL